MSKAYINVHLNGSIAIADLMKILPFMTIESDSPVNEAYADPSGAVRTPVAEKVEAIVAANPEAFEETVDAGAPDVDAHGHAWSELLHASTKGTTKEGLWRMKVGITRPAPMPGFPKEEAADTGTTVASTETQPEPSAPVTTASETAPVQEATREDDDEFAAFRNAAAEADATTAAAKASVPARKWTDADLGSLCNAAAVKLGDPNPVKELIAAHVPEGEVAHSRNIPEENREAFAKAVEAKAGIEFAG